MALQVGDIAIVGFSSDAVSDRKFVSFVLLADVGAGEVVNFTDSGWKSDGTFRANEGVLSWTAPSGGLTAGQVVTVQIDYSGSTATGAGVPTGMGSVTVAGGFNLATAGDQLLVYQGDAAAPVFLYALNNNGSGWQADATNANTSALPAGLGQASVALPHIDNYVYGGPLTGDKAALLAALGQSANWVSNDTSPGSLTLPPAFSVIAAAGDTQEFKPNGQGADASAAVALDDDYIVVGDDEANVLRVYHREGGDAVALANHGGATEWSYASFLGIGSEELDLEGGTRIGNTFYFTGSSGNKKSGVDHPSRENILAVTVTGTGADTQFTAVDKFTDLEAALVAWDNDTQGGRYGFAASSVGGGIEQAPESVAGFSIEGLTAKASSNTVLLGFRAPQVDGTTRDKALIVELNLGADGALTGASFGNAYELNLGGRGIRSIEVAEDGSGYLILAGPAGGASDEVTHDFRLFRWDGVSDTPEELDVDLDSLREESRGSFEAIVEVKTTAEGTRIQLLQDNGDNPVYGKDAPVSQQKFIGNWVTIGDVVADGAGPLLKSSTPVDDSGTAATTADIVLSFDEGVKAGDGSFVIRKASDGSVVETIAADSGKVRIAFNTVTLDPDADLEPGTAYYVETQGNAIGDHYGNWWAGLSGADALNFTTAEAPRPTVLITELNSNPSNGKDFFELYNYGGTAIDLGAWKVDDDSAAFASAVAFPVGTVLAPGEKAIVLLESNGGSDVTAFQTAWGIAPGAVRVISVNGSGLGLGGSGDAVVLFDGNGQVVTWLSYKTSAVTASDGTSITPLVRADGQPVVSGHAGPAVGATTGNATSAVWDGVSISKPQYTYAQAGVDGAFTSGSNVGSPGIAVYKPTLLITEINSNPADSNGKDFVELYNHGEEAIDLSGWKVDDDSAAFGSAAALPDLVLAPGEKLILLLEGEAGDVALFRTAWNLPEPSGVRVIPVSGSGLGLGGSGDAVVLFDGSGQVVTWLSYKTSAVTASDGTSITPLVRADGQPVVSGHAGPAVGATTGNATSAVWDGVSTSDPQYTYAQVNVNGGYAGSGNNIGSPGLTEAPVVPPGADPNYHQPFETAAGFAEFTVFSKDADAANAWYYSGGQQAAEVNAFGDAAAADDWLISKAFNLDGTSAEFLSFRTWTHFTDNGFAQPLTLKYATDYSGSGDPALATWHDLPFTASPQASQQWTDSGLIDLSGIAGTHVHFAFQYQSSGTGSSTSSSWRVDDFRIEGHAGTVVSIAATDAVKLEGDSGFTNFTFTVTRAGPADGEVTVDWAVTGSGASAADADDFGGAFPAGTVTFADGETTRTLDVPVQGDTQVEGAEGFTVTLSNATGGAAIVGGGAAQGTILSDDVDLKKISEVQGSGDVSPLDGSDVIVKGIVTHLAPGLNGFYVQSTQEDDDGDAATSEGIFVYGAISGLGVGDLVTLGGTVSEYYGLTEITYKPAVYSYVVDTAAGKQTLPAPVGITLPVSSLMTWEQVEGMLVTISSGTGDGSLVVTDNYNLGRYGEVTLTSDELLYQYTEHNGPDVAGFEAYNEAIKLDQIILDDGRSASNPDAHLGREGDPLSAGNPLRAGDWVTGVTGIVHQHTGTSSSTGAAPLPAAHETTYRIQATETPAFTGADRPTPADIPDAIANAEIKVGAFNVLNYFTTLGTASFTVPGTGISHEGRGASNAEEFTRQKDKIVEGILGLDADVLALNEIQNNGYGAGSALQDLVDALNAKAGPGAYDFVKGPFASGSGTVDAPGTDAIQVAILYKTANVELVGQAAAADPAVYDAFTAAKGSRVPVAQTFRSNASGETFTVVANHFKSKGSVNDPDIGDGQGANNQARVEAAQQLAAWLDTDPTGSGNDNTVLLGDFNAYSQEDPITWLDANGYDKVSAGYSYSFDGLWGSLDHAIVHESLADKVTGSFKWAINAEESTLLDYNLEYKDDNQDLLYYSPDAYRSSDHNPLLIGLDFGAAPPLNAAPTLAGLPASAQGVTVGQAAQLADFTVADADGDTLTVTLTPTRGSIGGLASGGDVTVTVSGGVHTLVGAADAISMLLAGATFTASAAGSASIAVNVDDGQGGSVSGTYVLSASGPQQPGNSAPTLAGLPGSAQAVTVGQAAPLADFTVADADGDVLTVTLVASNGSIGGLSAGSSGGATVTATANGFNLSGTAGAINALLAGATFTAAAAGSAAIAVSVSDGQGGVISGSYALSAAGVEPPLNNAPTLSGLPSAAQSVTAGQAAALADFTVADADGDTLTVTLAASNGSIGGLSAGSSVGVTVTAISGGFSLQGSASAINALLAGATFTAAAAGSASIAVSVSDGQGGNASGSYALAASGGGQEPGPGQQIVGTPHGDVLQGGAGDDRIDGGAGVDWVRSEGARAAHEIIRQEDGSWLVHSAQGGEDVLTGVERLLFDDGALALDVQGDGQAALAAKLIAVVLGPDAVLDPALFGEVLAYLDTLGEEGFLRALDDLGVVSAVAGGSDPASLLTLLHTHVAGRAPTAGELQDMLAFQQGHALDTAQTLAFVARLPQVAEHIGLDALAGQGIAFEAFDGVLLGSAQDDRLSAVPVGLRVDGREGVDTRVYGGEAGGYAVERQADGSYAVQAGEGGAVDRLWNVERLEFADRTGVALDLDGQAGDALRLLQALAGDEALENAGWVGQAIRAVDDMGLQGAAQAVVDAGLPAYFAGGSSLEALLTKVYANVTGAAPSAQELQWHMDFVQAQGMDAAQLLVLAAELPATAQRIDLVGLAQQGVAYEVWES